EEVVEGRKEDEREESGYGAYGAHGSGYVHALLSVSMLVCRCGDAVLGHAHEHEVQEGKTGEAKRECVDALHAAPGNEEPAYDRGCEEADAGDHADEAIRLVAPFFGNEDGDERRKRDG